MHLFTKTGSGRIWGKHSKTDAFLQAQRHEKRLFWRHLYIKTIILPRQAWDRHRKSTKKSAPFLSCRHERWLHLYLPESAQARVGCVNKTALFFEFSLYLSRACLGQKCIYIYKWGARAVASSFYCRSFLFFFCINFWNNVSLLLQAAITASVGSCSRRS